MDKPSTIYPEGFMSSEFEDMRNKLLDISGGRSRLLNLDHTRKGFVRFVDELPDQLAETLLKETAMTVIPVPEPTRELLIEHEFLQWDEETTRYISLKNDPDAKEWAQILGLKPNYELPSSSTHINDNRHTDLDLQTSIFEPALNIKLKKLASEAKTTIDETGNNILFLCLGFLEWYDQADEGKKRLAPLYMIPVRIEKESIRGIAVYKLCYTGEDIIPNLTLREKLRLDFDLVLPDVVESGEQEKLLSPEEYLTEVNALIARKRNDPVIRKWAVRRFGTLATLSLGKLLMYLDLDPNRWPDGGKSLLQHDVIKRFFQGDTKNSAPAFNSNPYVLDEVPNIHNKFPMIDDADSSQMSVLIDVLNGSSMVVEGPPGTGKSQTITNLIAAAIAQGKSVLFVAAKQAALDVVNRRMNKAGLGDFCLDLHSDKAQKRLVLDSLGERIANQGSYQHSISDFDLQVSRYERAREQLQDYANMVNQPWKGTGFSIHEILSAATRYGQEVAPLSYKDVAPEGISGNNITRAKLDEQLEQLKLFYDYLSIVSKQLDDPENWRSHPWYGIINKQLMSIDHSQITDLLANWNSSISALVEELFPACDQLEFSRENYTSLPDLEALISSWSRIPELSGVENLSAFRHIQPDDFPDIERIIRSYKNISDLYKTARSSFIAELTDDLSTVEGLEKEMDELRLLGVKPSTSFDDLSKSVLCLESAISHYKVLATVRAELLPHLNSDTAKLFPSSQDGFRELSKFIQHASSLPAVYIKFREDIFDGEELSNTLEEIRSKLNELEQDKEKQSSTFDLDNLPSADTLRKQSKVLSETSILSWLNSSWRETRNSVRQFSKEEKFDYKTMSTALEKAAKWKDCCDNFENTRQYDEVLGTQFNGLKTDCKRISILHDWYQQVRKDYGIGFGQRVPLAKSLFTLKGDVFLGIQNLGLQKSIPEKVGDFVCELDVLSKVFTNEKTLNSEDVLFDQNDNPLQILLLNIRESLRVGQGYLLNPNLPLSELLNAIAGLKALKSAISDTKHFDINTRFFDNQLDLAIDNKGALPKDLPVVQATFTYLKRLHQCTGNQDLLTVIVNSTNPLRIAELINDGAKFKELLTAIHENEQQFFSLSESSRELWFASNGLDYENIIQRNLLAINNIPWLDGWLKYLSARKRMESGGFIRLKQYLMQENHTLEHVKNVMCFATYQCLAHEVYREQRGLAERSGHEQTALQAQFAEYDSKLKELQRKRVAALAATRNVPPGTSGARVGSYTDDYLLNHEIKKGRRNISIRNLISRAGGAMQAYKPCFMMSPMAVAKYIAPDSLKFDLVIMDEASQVKPEYALSSFARGKQIVVVGDPKQLPPTNFFERSISNDGNLWGDNDGSIIDAAESILDAVSDQFPMRQLRWHYRSRHESLIEFSNHKFYDSNMVVFPSPWRESKKYGIKFNYIDKGRFLNSVNAPESRAVVNAIRTHLIEQTSSANKQEIESLGVVAMNSKQRDQIEADLETAISGDGALRAAYESNQRSEDPLFIKNLENVQGDERDVIFISFTYGPQEKGSVSIPQRFGPINGDAGWRRLNVLFTRSRNRIQVYSSMVADQIVLSETSSRGVKSLKGYLEFAQTGRLVGQTGISEGEPDSDFEIAVINALAKEGFECVPQVGVAGFFIDIAVRDPGMPGRYLMGIECDGATYHSDKSTRDRDRVRQSVLEGLNWKIRRIWSTDWFKHPEAELKPIIKELHLLTTPISTFDEVEPPKNSSDNTTSTSLDVDFYLTSVSNTLEELLYDFAINVIDKKCPDTEPQMRLLRPDMLERLVAEKPINKEEFTLFVPGYLRTHTSSAEAGKYLDDVLEIIADYEEREANQ